MAVLYHLVAVCRECAIKILSCSPSSGYFISTMATIALLIRVGHILKLKASFKEGAGNGHVEMTKLGK